MPVLTSEQLDAVLRAAAPLARDRQQAFVADVVTTLKTVPMIGPGIVYRPIAAAQRAHFDPPEFADVVSGPRSRRAP